MQRRNDFFSKAFFAAFGVVEYILSENRWARLRSNKKWVSFYESKFGTQPLFNLQTDYPLAYESVDHLKPRGAIRDNSSNQRFNEALKRLFPSGYRIKLLDLGCAGGGLVRSLLQDEQLAVGLEGSDNPKKYGLGEWLNCPLHLFTCDITKPFRLTDSSGQDFIFDVVTAWEVLEHIPKENLEGLISNISGHLSSGGYFIGSVDLTPDVNPLTGAVYHVTLEPKEWWLEIFEKHGFVELRSHPFAVEDYVRGNATGIKDWDPRAGDGFHLVLQKR